MQARFTVAVTLMRYAEEGKLARQRQAGDVTQQPVSHRAKAHATYNSFRHHILFHYNLKVHCF